MPSNGVEESIDFIQSEEIDMVENPQDGNALQIEETEKELLTIADFRSLIYNENPGTQDIRVGRESFLEEIFGVYKNPSFQMLQKPKVTFTSELS